MVKSIKKKAAKRPEPNSRQTARKAARADLVRGEPLRLSTSSAPGPASAVLDRLFAVVTERRTADPAVSHSARLLSRGVEKVAQKFGEEAVECLIEAVAGNRDALVAESADVLYHLMVLWTSAGVRPEQVWEELRKREGTSGIAEKAARAARDPVALAAERTKTP
ncbi:MAG: phosphoribosyl-ATP diphosphatase [Acetobacteraceae bacterium]|nr:phosphoribosyl-ATP diphosphatase [Acetobacteraceae bacterium]